MRVFFGIAYFVIGLVQLFAISDGIGHLLNWNGFFSMIAAFFITYIPLFGSALGVYGAMTVWDWSLWQAGALFFWYVPIFLALTLFGAAFNR